MFNLTAMKNTGAQILLKKLIEHNVSVVFEFPGGSICPILDELYKYNKIKTIVFKHEQAAIHAADGYARILMRPAVCMATSGPGASNLVTGIANAFMDSIPLVIITGQVAVRDLKKNRPIRQRGFQELDIVSVVRSITKAAYSAKRVSDLPGVIDKAFFIASQGRPGPVLVDIPINLQYTQSCRNVAAAKKYKQKALKCPGRIVKDTASQFAISKRPLIISGGGVILSRASSRLLGLLKSQRLVVLETLMGLTSVPSDYELNLGLVGYSGSRISEIALKEADFVLGLGIRFDNRAFPQGSAAFSKNAYIVHVDCDRNEFNHRVIADRTAWADVNWFLAEFNKKLGGLEILSKDCWRKRIKFLKRDSAPFSYACGGNRLRPQFILSKLSGMLKKKNIIVTTDVGQHQLWTAQHFNFYRENSLVTSGGLGAMGFGLPAAIGANFADRKARVFNITSDGSLQMNIQELATIRHYKLPIKIVLLNNKCLGLVRQIQEFAFDKRFESTLVNSEVDFVSIAKAYGINAFSVESENKVEAALNELVNSRESLLVDFHIGRNENVYPIRIKGKTIYNAA